MKIMMYFLCTEKHMLRFIVKEAFLQTQKVSAFVKSGTGALTNYFKNCRFQQGINMRFKVFFGKK